jgi:hypothetical protein
MAVQPRAGEFGMRTQTMTGDGRRVNSGMAVRA